MGGGPSSRTGTVGAVYAATDSNPTFAAAGASKLAAS